MGMASAPSGAPTRRSLAARAQWADPTSRARLLAGLLVSSERRRVDRLVESNLHVLDMFARKAGRSYPSVEECDVRQSAFPGLVRAARTFDPTRGASFVTWAFWWCRASLQEALPTLTSTIRVPKHPAFAVPKVRSMDAPGPASRTAMRDRLPDPDAEDPLAHAVRAELPERVEAALSRLTHPRDDEFVRLRFGLDGGGERTLAHVGRLMGCSNERARQRVTRALAELAELLAGE